MEKARDEIRSHRELELSTPEALTAAAHSPQQQDHAVLGPPAGRKRVPLPQDPGRPNQGFLAQENRIGPGEALHGDSGPPAGIGEVQCVLGSLDLHTEAVMLSSLRTCIDIHFLGAWLLKLRLSKVVWVSNHHLRESPMLSLPSSLYGGERNFAAFAC